MNVLYINEKQAAARYGLSASWFQKQRWQGTGPQFVKLKAKVLYPVDLTDQWFKQQGLRSSTSTNDNQGGAA